MKTPVRQLVVAFVVGLLFAVGLALSCYDPSVEGYRLLRLQPWPR